MARYEVNDDITVKFNIDNVFDKDYYSAIVPWNTAVMCSEPVSKNLGVRYSF